MEGVVSLIGSNGARTERFLEERILSTVIREISPELATKMLEGSYGNRKRRPHLVAVYAEAMKRGQWRTTHQGLAIDEAGNLLDGQHRLLAVVKSGVTVRMMVTTYQGFAGGRWHAFDLGNGGRNLTDITGIDKWYVQTINAWFVCFYWKRQALDPEQVARIYRTAGETLEAMHSRCPSYAKVMSAAPVRAAFALRAIGGLERFDQYTAMVRGVGMEQATQALSKRLYDLDRSSAQGITRQRLQFCFAWLGADPSKTIVVRKADSTIAEAKSVFESFFLDVLTAPGVE